LAAEVVRSGLGNLTLAPCFSVTDEMFERDGVHLIPVAGDKFLDHLSRAITNVTSEVTNDDDRSDLTMVGDTDSDSSEVEDITMPESDADKLGAILSIVRSNS